MTDYADWVLLDRPRWLTGLRDGWGQLWHRAIGSIADITRDAAAEAVRLGMVSRSPDDAVPYHGAERMLDQYPSETIDAWRERLGRVWDQWEQAGRVDGLTYQLERYGVDSVTIMEDGIDPVTPGDGPSRFVVVLGDGADAGSLPWEPLTMPFTMEDTTLGSTATPAEVSQVRAIVRRWKSGHSLTVAIILRFPGGTVTDPYWPISASNDTCTWVAANSTQSIGFRSLPFTPSRYREDRA